MRRKVVLLAALLFVCGVSNVIFAQSYTDGIEYFKSGQPERSKIILNKTMDDPSTYKAEALYYLGESEFALGNKDAALENYSKGIKLDSNYPYNYIGRGKLMLEKNQKVAEGDFKQAIKLAKKANCQAGVSTNISRAYFEAGLPQYKKYLDSAMRTDNRYAPAYVLHGDVYGKEGNVGEAAGMYEMAQSFDPSCIEAYVKYALLHYPINPKYATNKLEELLRGHPNSAIAQRELAEAYFHAGRYNEAVAAYARYMANPNHFNNDRARHAALLYFDKKYEESLTLIEQTLLDDPDNLILNRFAMYDNFELENYEQAVGFGKKYIDNSNNTKYLTSQDFMVYGKVLKALNKPSEYVAAFEGAVKIDPLKAELYKELSDAYKAAGEILKSADAMGKYMDIAGENVVTNDYFSLGKIYYQAAGSLTDLKVKKEIYNKADSVFAIVVSRVPEDYRGYLWRARSQSGMDPETEVGLAKPYYEKVIAIIEANKDSSQDSAVVEAYRYMGYYNYIKEYAAGSKKYPETKKWWNKILERDPENEIKNTLSQLE